MLIGITKQIIKNLAETRIIPEDVIVEVRKIPGDDNHFDIISLGGTRIHNIPAEWIELHYIPRKPEKPQRFSYIFSEPKDGDSFASLEHIRHAICNSDQYPVDLFNSKTPEGKLQAAVLDAVIEAIKSVPVYIYQGETIKKEE